jgi:hypothetical protein
MSTNVLDFVPGTLHNAIRNGDNTTILTSYIQNAINELNAMYIGGSQGGGGGGLYFPGGKYRTEPLIMKNGVNLYGDHGTLNSQLMITGNHNVLLAASEDSSTATSADNLYYGEMANLALLSWEGANGGTPVGQVGWDIIGFRWWRTFNCLLGWGAGLTAVRGAGSELAGTGGPSQWYNEFFGCLLHKHYASTGGIGMLLGDSSVDKEQVTTLRFYGGDARGNGSGTAVHIQGGTGNIFDSTTFESCAAAVVLGSATGTRQSHFNEFRSCYFEGNTENWNIHLGSTHNLFKDGFVTGGTFTDYAANLTRYRIPGLSVDHLRGSSSSDGWQVKTANGALYRPAFEAETFPSIELRDGSANKLIMARGSFSTDAALFFADDLSIQVAAFGGTSSKLRSNNLRMRDDDAFGVFSGAGSPEGVVTAKPGSQYLNTSGGAVTAVYFKEAGTGNTGWVAK